MQEEKMAGVCPDCPKDSMADDSGPSNANTWKHHTFWCRNESVPRAYECRKLDGIGRTNHVQVSPNIFSLFRL
jgi:hypothetical protein